HHSGLEVGAFDLMASCGSPSLSFVTVPTIHALKCTVPRDGISRSLEAMTAANLSSWPSMSNLRPFNLDDRAIWTESTLEVLKSKSRCK
ncbi:MAG: hypothetical protein ACREOH_09475, partial [Candidatus Entotheonellia bacterium]